MLVKRQLLNQWHGLAKIARVETTFGASQPYQVAWFVMQTPIPASVRQDSFGKIMSLVFRVSTACAEQETFVRGGPTLTMFFF